MRSEPAPALILGTHDLGPEAAGRFAEDRDYWMPFDEFKSLYEALEAQAAATGVTLQLTSDDGFLSDYTALTPWLVDSGRTATFFVPAGFIGRAGHLSVSQVREMHWLGLRFGCHGVDHLEWPQISEGRLAHEVAGGKRRLEDLLGAEVTAVAPPYGAYDRRVYRALCDVGFGEIYTCRGGYSVPRGRLRPRVMLQRRSADALLALSRRRPNLMDRVRCGAHEWQARLPIRG